jgi:hypothetical protein
MKKRCKILSAHGKDRGIDRAIFFLSVLCIAGCDNFNQSIETFIYAQTGTVLPRGSAIIASPLAEQDADGAFHVWAGAGTGIANIVVELGLDNSRGYDLRIEALDNGVASDALTVEQAAPSLILIRIAEARPGDLCRIVLKVGTADGRRTFEDISLPDIYCDPPLPGQGSISITFSGAPQDENILLTGTPDNALSWSTGALSLNAPTTGVFSGASYQWSLDGQELAGETSSSYSAAGNTFTLARHQVAALITTATGTVYSKAIVFIVE